MTNRDIKDQQAKKLSIVARMALLGVFVVGICVLVMSVYAVVQSASQLKPDGTWEAHLSQQQAEAYLLEKIKPLEKKEIENSDIIKALELKGERLLTIKDTQATLKTTLVVTPGALKDQILEAFRYSQPTISYAEATGQMTIVVTQQFRLDKYGIMYVPPTIGRVNYTVTKDTLTLTVPKAQDRPVDYDKSVAEIRFSRLS